MITLQSPFLLALIHIISHIYLSAHTINAPICQEGRCSCRVKNEKRGNREDEKGNEKRLQAVIIAQCPFHILRDNQFGKLLSKSPAVTQIIFLSPSTSETEIKNTTESDESALHSSNAKFLTLPWKTVARRPSLKILDISSVHLSCSCDNAWLAYWTPSNFSLVHPLVSPDILLSLSARRRRTLPNGESPAGPQYLHIINEEPHCPYNCSLTTAELFRLPEQIIFHGHPAFPHNIASHFSHCLPNADTDASVYFAQKCGLYRLKLDKSKVIEKESDSFTVSCKRVPVGAVGEEGKRGQVGSACPSLRLSPFMRSTYKNESDIDENNGNTGNETSSTPVWTPFLARCITADETLGEKRVWSRNESGWLVCQDDNAYLPQAALAPFIVTGPPQILEFHQDSQGEQMHLTFHITSHPRPKFGWHHILHDHWLKPDRYNGFEVILASKPSFGHYVISGRATFRELSMRCGLKGDYDFQVCNEFGCDKRRFTIHQGVPTSACRSLLSSSRHRESPDSSLNKAKDNLPNNLNLQFSTSPPPPFSGENQENWVYIAVPFLVVLAVVLVGTLTTCLFLRLVGHGLVGGHHYTRKTSSSRWKSRQSLSEWEMSPLNQHHLTSLEVNSSYVDWLQHVEKRVRVFSATDLTVISELGEGAFGRVLLVKATFADRNINRNDGEPGPCTSTSPEQQQEQHSSDGHNGFGYYAMKLLKNVTSEKLQDLEREAAIMSQLDHPNVVQFFGLSCKHGSLGLLFEYMEFGDLVNYLRDHSPEISPCPDVLQENDLLAIALQIARGLEYLADRHLVHRDLAARNCLVGKNMIVKISDFGMTRDIYITDYYKMGTRTLVPLRWLPPESILYRKFTVESDIWSFGVLTWEIFSYGKIPWYMHSNSEVFHIIQEGKLLERPDGCPEEVYNEIMLRCWTKQPSERLAATQVRTRLERLIENRLTYCSVLPSPSDIAQTTMDTCTAQSSST